MWKGTSIAFAGALGLALLAGPSAAQNYESIKLRVPVQLKSMLAAQVGVTCNIHRREGGSTKFFGSQESERFNIVNGTFDQVIEVVVTPDGGQDFAQANGYQCFLRLYEPGGGDPNPLQGTPSGNNDPKLYRLARPDSFFRAETKHTLDGLKVGIGGPKDLKGKKQP